MHPELKENETYLGNMPVPRASITVVPSFRLGNVAYDASGLVITDKKLRPVFIATRDLKNYEYIRDAWSRELQKQIEQKRGDR